MSYGNGVPFWVNIHSGEKLAVSFINQYTKTLSACCSRSRRRWQTMKVQLLLIATLAFLLAGCSHSNQTGNPKWVDQLIRQFESDPVGNPPLSIWRYEYNGQLVYYVPPHCCDIPGSLYDADGNVLCNPGGGIKGDGDGRCSDFISKRTNEQLIWQDPR